MPATIPPQTVRISASGVASVRVACPADSGGCKGTVALVLPRASASAASAARKRATIRLGRARFDAAAGTESVVPVRLSKRGRQRIVKGRRGRGRARIVVTTRKADGTKSVATQDVAIHVKRHPAKRKARRR